MVRVRMRYRSVSEGDGAGLGWCTDVTDDVIERDVCLIMG